MPTPEHFAAVVVGSGFGGAVTAARLAETGLSVLVLERGKAYPPGSFPRSPAAMRKNLWHPSAGLHGMFDLRSFHWFDSLVASGLGGGSLIDANVMVRKDEHWFVTDDRTGGAQESWPVSRADLDPHYDRVERLLDVQTYPLDRSPYDRTARTLDFRDAAKDLGLDWFLPKLAVTFGNDGDVPVPGVPIREARPNIHRRVRQSCRLCGECVIGCNYGAKNTLDYTYLTAARHDGAEIRTLCEVREFAPRGDGSWTITYIQHDAAPQGQPTDTQSVVATTVTADRLVLSAGTFGTPCLLMRNRRSLPGLSDRIGEGFSSNGDLLSFALRGVAHAGRTIDPANGPVVTCAIRIPDEHDGGGAAGRGAYIEDAGYPELASWMLDALDGPEAAPTSVGLLAHAAMDLLRHAAGADDPAASHPFGESRLASRVLQLLAMGRDVPDGKMSLEDGVLQVDWSKDGGSQAYFDEVRQVSRELAERLGGEFVDNPLWLANRTITVHALGGARMGATDAEGVVDPWGRVYNCPNLHIADGSVMPGSVGANPAMTIAALADRFCDAIIEGAPESTRRGRRPAATASRALPPVPAADPRPTVASWSTGRSTTEPALRVAVLDADGTVAAGLLGAPLPRRLLEAGLCRHDRFQQLNDFLTSLAPDSLEDPDVAQRFCEMYAAVVEGASADAVNGVVHELWNRQREEIFSFVPPLIADLRHAGFTPMLISNGPHELLRHLAGHLAVDLFCGIELESADGVHTGVVSPSVAAPKDRRADALAEGRQICWSESVAIGSSLADAELLERAGHPFAFEPSPALTARAREGAWHIADRDSLLSIARSRLGIGQQPTSEIGPVRGVSRSGEWDLPVRLSEAEGRLTEHVISQVTNGAIRGHCGSRVVESSLMLTLLRREGLLPGCQAALRAYLVRRAPGAQLFDATLIDAVLKAVRVDDPNRILDRVLATTDDSGDSERLVLSAALAVVDAAPFARHLSPDAFNPYGEGPWIQLSLLAIGILYRSEYGPADGPEVDQLLHALELGQSNGVWEKQVFTHLLALLAVNRARPGHRAIREGVAHLTACQNLDGGMPFIASKEIFSTATAGLALARAGAHHRVLASMADYLANHQGSNGGWPFTPGVSQADVDSTAFTTMFLQAVSPARYGEALSRARGYLRSMAGVDGGFPTYLPGHPSDAWMTASAMAALTPHGFSHQPILDHAAGFLLDAQRPDGTFGRAWSLSEAACIFLSVLALGAAHDHDPASHFGRIRASIDSARYRLLYTANSDGGWGHTPACRSDPISTAYSLIALAGGHPGSQAIRGGAEYLLSQQRPHGGYVCPADQVGPRPLPYMIPILAENFVLLAMTHVSPGIRGEGASGAINDR